MNHQSETVPGWRVHCPSSCRGIRSCGDDESCQGRKRHFQAKKVNRGRNWWEGSYQIFCFVWFLESWLLSGNIIPLEYRVLPSLFVGPVMGPKSYQHVCATWKISKTLEKSCKNWKDIEKNWKKHEKMGRILKKLEEIL